MKKIVALAGLLLVVTAACGKQTANSEPAPTCSSRLRSLDDCRRTDAAPAEAPDRRPAASTGERHRGGRGARRTRRRKHRATRAEPATGGGGDGDPAANRDRAGRRVSTTSCWCRRSPPTSRPTRSRCVEMFWYGVRPLLCARAVPQELEGKKKAPYIQFTRLPVIWGTGTPRACASLLHARGARQARRAA